MPPEDEQVRRKARVLAAYMTGPDASEFAQSFVLDPLHFNGEWATRSGARARIPNGYQPPRINDLPESAAPHIAAVQACPEFSSLYGSYTPAFKLIELGRLVALQYWVDVDFADGMHGSGDAPMPTEDELLKSCLPLDVLPNAHAWWKIEEAPGRVTLSVYSHNNTFHFRPGYDKEAGEITFVIGAQPNLMYVNEVGGRFFLMNGYHRAWWLLSKGITMAPVMILAAPPTAVIRPGAVRPEVLMEVLMGDQPPLVEHYLDDKMSFTEDVRSTLRVVRVTAETSVVPRFLGV